MAIQRLSIFFHILSVHHDIIEVFYSPNDAQVTVLKTIVIYTKIAPTCFDAVTPSSGSALSVLAKVIPA